MKTAPAALPLPRRAKVKYPGHDLHGKVVTVVTEEMEFPWRRWKLGHKVEVRAEGYRHLILLSIENIQEIETPADT